MLGCKVGLVQRAERILGLGVLLLFFGAGRQGMLLLGIVLVLAVLAVVTVIQRIHHVYKLTGCVTRKSAAPALMPALADSLKKGRSGD